MGIFGDRRPELIVKAAQDSYARGALRFTPVMEWPRGVAGNTFSVDEWAETLRGVEAAGWELMSWAVVPGKEPTAYPVFRRR